MTASAGRHPGLFPEPGEVDHIAELLVSSEWRRHVASELLDWLDAEQLATWPRPVIERDRFAVPSYRAACASLSTWLRLSVVNAEPPREPAEVAAEVAQFRRQVATVIEYRAEALALIAAKESAGRAGRGSKLPKARKAQADNARDRERRFDDEILRRVKAGEQWRGMAPLVSEALGVPLSTAGGHVRRVRKAIEKDNNRT